MSAYLKSLTEQRARVWEEAKGLLDTAAGEKRELSVDERSKYDGLNTALDSMGADIQAFADQEARALETARIVEGLNLSAGSAAVEPEVDLDSELRSVLLGEKRGLDVETASLWTPEGVRQAVPGAREYRANVEGVATAGGNTVPVTFVRRLLEPLFAASSILTSNATILNTSSGEPIKIPRVSAYSTAAMIAEATTMTVSDPAFDQVNLSAYKYYVLNAISRELLEDSAFDIAGFVARQAGQRLGLKIGSELVSANGTGKPFGVLQGITAGKTGSTGVGGTPNGDDLIDLYYSVAAPYRANASWVMADGSMAAIRKLKDTTGQYLFQPSLVAGTPDTILGKPVYFDPSMPAYGVGANAIAFGDLSTYFVRIVNGIRFEVDTSVGFKEDLVYYKTVMRVDGAATDVNAIKAFKGAAS